MVYEVHPSSEELEAYSLGQSSDTELEKTEEHLLICERCQDELALNNAAASSETGKRLRSVHITEDGPIFGAMHGRSD
jgi:anti-sigma factor ChrR (cupin superfamily)